MALVVITGAARSGKSAAAQRLAHARAGRGVEVVVAVFGVAQGDAEFAARIERHRTERPTEFRALEAGDSRSWRKSVPDEAVLVVECLGTLAALMMGEATGDLDTDTYETELESALDGALAEFVAWVSRRSGDTIVVTNETGWGVVPAYASGRVFRDALGRANTVFVTIADAAYLAVNGRVLDLGALPRDVSWPSD
ncbi:MAG: bifunctional adenosylcobinamide kinase/adenosylcobinamide-phosphate guanylyltransferase [Coriobacteriia bacterium]|nr:bifunctional adenosylcobinamide kinase/adenosylcobinamide-phosphate guanylyltransferase [Coriobacteriia bacterium]